MDRLTEHGKDYRTVQINEMLVPAALNRLAAYEDTEHSPEDIEMLIRAHKALREENAYLRELEADNAALTRAWEAIQDLTENREEKVGAQMNGGMLCNREQAEYLVSNAISEWKKVFATDHPGAALLKELEGLRRVAAAAREACGICPINCLPDLNDRFACDNLPIKQALADLEKEE